MNAQPAEWPEEIWIGITRGKWPIQAFINSDQAARWLGEDEQQRRVFQVDTGILAELEYIPPVEASYRIVRGEGAR